jgi:hypothetical protein
MSHPRIRINMPTRRQQRGSIDSKSYKNEDSGSATGAVRDRLRQAWRPAEAMARHDPTRAVAP